MLVLVAALRGAESEYVQLGANAEIGLVKNLGRMLFNEFLLPFEIVSVLLLAAMVGAVMLGKTPLREVQQQSRVTNGASKDQGVTKIPNVKQFTNE